MSKISIKKDFKDGEKLFAEQLNNNFAVIETGVNANEEDLEAVIQDAETRLQKELENITVDRGWDWGGSSTDRVTFYKGTTDAVNAQAIKNGQMLYNTETGETALDDNGERIITGSGNVVSIGSEQPTNNATKIWIDPEEIGEPLPHQLVVSPEEPVTGEEVWFKNDEQKAVMVKDKDGNYKEFVKPQVKVGVEEPTTGEEVWIKKSDNHLDTRAFVNETKNGLTLTYDNGLFTITGKATDSTSFLIDYILSNLVIGETYTLSALGDTTGITNFGFKSSGGSDKFIVNNGVSKTVVMTQEIVNAVGRFDFYIGEGQTVDASFYVQLTQGEEIPATYTPYVDKEIYVKNDNDVYELFNKVESPQYCQAKLNADKTLSFSATQWENQFILFDSIYDKVGDFKLENGKIVIGKNISKIKVSFHICLYTVATAKDFGIYLVKNNTNVVGGAHLCETHSSLDNTSICSVAEGDEITLKIQNVWATANTIKVQGSSTIPVTHILIEKIA